MSTASSYSKNSVEFLSQNVNSKYVGEGKLRIELFGVGLSGSTLDFQKSCASILSRSFEGKLPLAEGESIDTLVKQLCSFLDELLCVAQTDKLSEFQMNWKSLQTVFATVLFMCSLEVAKRFFLSCGNEEKVANVGSAQWEKIHQMSILASLAYCSDEEIKKTLPSETSGLLFCPLKKLSSGLGRVVLFENPTLKEFIIVFRGTTTVSDWLTNLKGISKAQDGNHVGFEERKTLFISELDEEVQKMAITHKLTFVGHSLGAAVASLVASHFEDGGLNVHCYCFSPPPVFVVEEEAKKKIFTTIVLGCDIVPSLSIPGVQSLAERVVSVGSVLHAVTSDVQKVTPQQISNLIEALVSPQEVKNQHFHPASDGVLYHIMKTNDGFVAFERKAPLLARPTLSYPLMVTDHLIANVSAAILNCKKK